MIGGTCRSCGSEHKPEEVERLEYRPRRNGGGTRVKVTSGPLAGTYGTFHHWSRYGCPLTVTIRFYGQDIRHPQHPGEQIQEWSFDPCELEIDE